MENNMNKEDELQWNNLERVDLENRILNLRDDQIAALLNLVGLDFHLCDIKDVVIEIRKNTNNAIHLDILLTEAHSKERLLWWIKYFEENNE